MARRADSAAAAAWRRVLRRYASGASSVGIGGLPPRALTNLASHGDVAGESVD